MDWEVPPVCVCVRVCVCVCVYMQSYTTEDISVEKHQTTEDLW